jgi:hypothetical protein
MQVVSDGIHSAIYIKKYQSHIRFPHQYFDKSDVSDEDVLK